MSYNLIVKDLKANANLERAKYSTSNFPRQIGDRVDQFYGGTVPSTRLIAKLYRGCDFL